MIECDGCQKGKIPLLWSIARESTAKGGVFFNGQEGWEGGGEVSVDLRKNEAV